MVRLTHPDGPVPAILTVFVLGIAYLAVLSAWTVARLVRRGGERLHRPLERLTGWLSTFHRPA